MKSFRGTFMSSIARAVVAIENRADAREYRAKMALEKAVGPAGVAKAKKALKAVKQARVLTTQRELLSAIERMSSKWLMRHTKTTDGTPSVTEHENDVYLDSRKIMGILMRMP